MIHFFPFILGAIIGSFLNVCIHRIPLEQSIVSPRSHCPKCKKTVAWYDNIPILSFILLGGRCRGCRNKISLEYPLVELLTGVLSLAFFHYCRIYYMNNLVPYFLFFFLLVAPLITITFIDLHHQIIPDVISLPGIIAGIATNLYLSYLNREASFMAPILFSIKGILAGGGSLFLVSYIYEKIKKQEGLGGGDVKLAAMLGAFFGWKGVLLILFFSSLVGSVIGIIVMLRSKEDFKLAIPYGPFLAIGTFIHFFFGDQLLTWYLSFFKK